MAFEQNELSGALFKNDRRTATNNQPNATGSCKIDGQFYWVSAWTKTAKSGQKYQSLAFTLKDDDENRATAPTEDYDDDIPF